MPTLSGNYENDLQKIEHALELLARLEQDSARGVQIGGAANPRLDCQVIQITTPNPSAAFDVEHALGRVPRYFWIVYRVSGGELNAWNQGQWTSTRLTLKAAVVDAPFTILIA